MWLGDFYKRISALKYYVRLFDEYELVSEINTDFEFYYYSCRGIKIIIKKLQEHNHQNPHNF